MHFLWASLSNHIASLLLFFIAQGSHKGLGFKVEGIDFTTQWGGVSKPFSKKSMLIKDVVTAILANTVGYIPPEIYVPTLLPLFWAADLNALHIKWFLHSPPFPWVPPIWRSEGERTVSLGYLLTKIYPCKAVLTGYTQDQHRLKTTTVAWTPFLSCQ